MRYHLNPADPTQVPIDLMPQEFPDMKDLSLEEQEQVCITAAFRSCASSAVFIILSLALCILFGSCTTQRTVADTLDQRYSRQMLQRMDSLLSVRSVTQQDSAFRQEILRQFQSIREKSDTSRSVTLSAAGDTIRERIVINTIRETTSTTYRQLLTVLFHRLQLMDSTVQQQSLQLVSMDSLLRRQNVTIEVPVEKQLSWLQQMQIWLGRLVLVALALLAAHWLLRKRAWWLRLIRKLF